MKDIVETFYFDTYAIMEIIFGNKSYAKYTACNIVISIYNIQEIYFNLLKNFGEEKADCYTDIYAKAIVDVDLPLIKQAMKFKLKNKEKNVSYTDAIGYSVALKKGIRFLTGDKQFKNLPNVEFVR